MEVEICQRFNLNFLQPYRFGNWVVQHHLHQEVRAEKVNELASSPTASNNHASPTDEVALLSPADVKYRTTAHSVCVKLSLSV